MSVHVCPWWLAFTFDNRLRRFVHPPEKTLGSCVTPGMTALDLGCGLGYWSIALARMVGDDGLVISADLQQKMLAILEKRAQRAGVRHRIRTHRSQPDQLGIDCAADFALAFWIVHEVPDQRRFLTQVRSCLRQAARFLIVEPRLHVSARAFRDTIELASETGFRLSDEPHVPLSRAALFSIR